MRLRRPIRVMPDDIILKIAAGEVAERPASVVKELLDNAIDAGATVVKIEIREAGLKLIRVTDNGCGIPQNELPLAFTSHATSKVAGLDDLQQLTTLGFRGEALPSISAVSRVEVQTRVPGEALGTRFMVEFGETMNTSICSVPDGLRISISDLFANVPARRTFVRSLRAEAGQIQATVTQYALAQPAVQFTLTIDGRVTFHSPGTGQLGDAVAAVYGPDILAKMIPLEMQPNGIAVNGLISVPEFSRQNRSGITIVVNGRAIQNRSLGFALEEAYSGFLMTGRHPLAIVHLAIPPGEVDANIHPSKTEVRFAREREVHSIVHRSTATALLTHHMKARSPVIDVGSSSPDVDAKQHELLEEIPDNSPTSIPLASNLPLLRVFGQSNTTFIIAEGPDGLYMIDQHAAHERVLYDQLDAQTSSQQRLTQPLLQPASLDLNPAQIQALDTNHQLLLELGFVIEPFGDSACLIRAIPALARRGQPSDMVSEVLHELEAVLEPAAARERALAALACKAAVKAGQMLDVQEMRQLVVQLEQTSRPSTCPHGRPTMIRLSHTQLEREFGRR